MPITTFSQEEKQSFVNEIIKQLVPVLLQELQEKQIPPVLNRKRFMELVGISSNKCNELFNRQDFPVNRELGHPRVITKDFFLWASSTSQNADEINFKQGLKII